MGEIGVGAFLAQPTYFKWYVRLSSTRSSEPETVGSFTAPCTWQEMIRTQVRSQWQFCSFVGRGQTMTRRPWSPLPDPSFGECRSLLAHTPELAAPVHGLQVSLRLCSFSSSSFGHAQRNKNKTATGFEPEFVHIGVDGRTPAAGNCDEIPYNLIRVPGRWRGKIFVFSA